MTTASRSSNLRAIPLKARSDLNAREVSYLNESCWVLKDPVKLKYFRLQPQQYAILQLLDGQRNIDQILAEFQIKFPGKRLTRTQVQNIVFDLYQQGLIWSTRSGQGSVLDDRGITQQLKQLKQKCMNVLFIRLPGVDPTKILKSGYPLAKWIFHPAVVMWACAVVILSWVFIATHASEFASRMPNFESLITWETTLKIWLILGITKVIHELGHAFACRHFGGECHEIGMAFLVFSPCLYCDVSDSWILKNKWKRMAIAFAGIYIELLLAAIAFFVWWNTLPGQVNQICLFVFVVCNVSTLLFNLNPLLRLDGYYLLSDWLEIPNLRQKSEKIFEHKILNLVWGITPEHDPFLPTQRRGTFAAYTIASMLYRALLVVVISGLLYTALKPWRMEFLGLLVGIISGGLGAYSWFHRLHRAVKNHHLKQEKRSMRPYVISAVGLMILGLVLFLPIPISLKASLRLEHANAQNVYAKSAGQLAAIHIQPGETVRSGEILLQLADEEKFDRLNQLLVMKRVQSIELKKYQALSDAKEIELTREKTESLDREIADQKSLIENLTIRAPCDGVVIQSQPKPTAPEDAKQLSHWSGTPLDSVNRGCFLQPATHLMTVAPNEHFQGIMVVDQIDVHALEVGQEVKIKLDHAPETVLTGLVTEISAATVSEEDSAVSSARRENPEVELYHATLSLDTTVTQSKLLGGMQGAARVSIKSQTSAAWIWRNVRSTFNFQL